MNETNIPEMKRVKEKHERFLLSLPNVQAVGIGPKITEGSPTGQLAIKVFVRQKVALDDLAERERVPEELDGYPTDVEVLGELRAQ